MDASRSQPGVAGQVVLTGSVDRPGFVAEVRLRAALAVAVLHGLLIWAIIHGLAGGALPLERPLTAPVVRVYNVVATPLQPPPRPEHRLPDGAKAPPAKRARATPVVAPKLSAVIPPRVVTAPAASSGSAALSGAAAAGTGSGAGGAGQGTGAGDSGSGTGGGIAQKAIKLSGDINSTRDYPADPDLKRLGSSVIVRLTVRIDGRGGDCRVQRPSVDPQADVVTCRLAVERFRFRPATDATGHPVESIYGWRQSWFRPPGSLLNR